MLGPRHDRSADVPVTMTALALLRAMRPHQWVKNVFVLAALFFSLGAEGQPLTDLERALRVAHAFVAFCLGSSAIYLLNDVVDVERDRQHPTKRLRPIAAGQVGISTALVTAALCVGAALLLGQLATTELGSVTATVAVYMAINLAYSLRLKHIVIVDAFCIAAGFLLRVLAGGFAAAAPVSHWLLLCTLFLALFLALCKRQAEISLLGEDRGRHRSILLEYTPAFLDQVTVVVAACAIVCYSLYTVSDETAEKFGDTRLVWTVPFVVFGLFRYLLLVQTRKAGGSPSRVLLGGDVPFVLNCLLWLATVTVMLFYTR